MINDKVVNNVIPIRQKSDVKYIESSSITIKEADPMVLSISSGKGGVGKTNIVANLGYAFCKMGKKVLIFDADLGLGNLDILLGLTPKFNLSHFILAQKNIDEIIVDGPLGMKIIPAASGIKELAHLSKENKIPILQKIDDLVNQFDIFLIDNGAGISNNVLHFAAIAQDVLVVVSPEPTSLTDAYALIKVLSYHYGVSKFNLVVNMVNSSKEAEDVYHQLLMVTDRFLNVSIHYTGHVLRDDKITKGIKRQKVISEIYPEAPASICFQTLAGNILKIKREKKNKDASNFIWESLLNY